MVVCALVAEAAAVAAGLVAGEIYPGLSASRRNDSHTESGCRRRDDGHGAALHLRIHPCGLGGTNHSAGGRSRRSPDGYLLCSKREERRLILPYQLYKLLFRGLRKKLPQVGQQAPEALFGRVGALACGGREEVLGSVEQRPTPTVAVAVPVCRVDEVFGHHAAGHLQACDIAVEAGAHLCSVEAAGRAELTGDHAAVDAEDFEDGALDAVLRRFRILGTAVVAEVGPPVHGDEARFPVKELAVGEMPFGDHRPFPVPERPVPSVVGHHVAAFGCHELVGREAGDAAVQQGNETNLLDGLHEVGAVADGFHWSITPTGVNS